MVFILLNRTKTSIPRIIGSLTYYFFKSPIKKYQFYSQEIYLESAYGPINH
jgi:hypothetical protein